jgi:hypothetical protein
MSTYPLLCQCSPGFPLYIQWDPESSPRFPWDCSLKGLMCEKWKENAWTWWNCTYQSIMWNLLPPTLDQTSLDQILKGFGMRINGFYNK